MDNLKREKVGVNWYRSLAELYDDAETGSFVIEARLVSFFGHKTVREAIEYCRHGLTEKDTEQARKLYTQVDTGFRDRTRLEWQPSVAGAYACVPEYLQGQPEHMRTMHDNVSDKSPITFWIEGGVSGGLNDDAVRMRAAAIAAMVMRTSEKRPVELNVFTADKPSKGQPHVFVAPIDSHPVSLTETLGAIGTKEYSRAVAFALPCGVVIENASHVAKGERCH